MTTEKTSEKILARRARTSNKFVSGDKDTLEAFLAWLKARDASILQVEESTEGGKSGHRVVWDIERERVSTQFISGNKASLEARLARLEADGAPIWEVTIWEVTEATEGGEPGYQVKWQAINTVARADEAQSGAGWGGMTAAPTAATPPKPGRYATRGAGAKRGHNGKKKDGDSATDADNEDDGALTPRVDLQENDDD